MKLILTYLFFVSLMSINNVTEALQVVTMETYKTDINLDSTLWGSSSAGILKSHSVGSYQTGMAKTLNINAPFGSSILATIRLIDLRPNCIDNFTLYDSNNRFQAITFCNRGKTARRDYDKYERKTFYVSSGKLGVIFNTNRFGSTFLYDGFQLTFTVVNSVPCKSYEYRCSTVRCISDSIRCDGYNHCGDGSSEMNCYSSRTGRTAGIVIGCVFLVIGIIMALIYGLRRCRSPVRTETVITSHPPSSYPVNPPPAYTTAINNQSTYPATAYPPPGYTTYPQGHSNPAYR